MLDALDDGLIISNIFPRHNVEYCAVKAAIALGDIRKHGTAQSARSREIVERIISNTPMKRYGRIDELKGTVVYLASRVSSFMTGNVVVVNGGFTIW